MHEAGLDTDIMGAHPGLPPPPPPPSLPPHRHAVAQSSRRRLAGVAAHLTAAATTGTDALLRRHGADGYQIEFGGFLTNHIAHGLVALDALKAPPELMQRFVAAYSPKLLPAEPAAPPLLTTAAAAADVLASAPLGSRTGFDRLRAAFDLQLGSAGSDAELRATVAAHLPDLIDGLSGAAFHAFIHTAIGVRTGSRSLVSEGLAYMSHSWLPVGGAEAALLDDSCGWGVGATGLLESVAAIRADGELQRRLADAWDAVEPLPTGYFQKCMFAFAAVDGSAATAAAAEALLRYAKRVALPTEPAAAAEVLLEASLQLYVRTVGSDYFLLHGVTAAFSLVTLLPLLLLGGDDEGSGPAVAARRAVRRFLLALLATYVAQRSPGLCPLESALLPLADGPSAAAWSALRQEAVAPTAEVRNEHAFKLVWMCLERAAEPGVPRAHGELLYAAARKALRASLTGRTGERPI